MEFRAVPWLRGCDRRAYKLWNCGVDDGVDSLASGSQRKALGARLQDRTLVITVCGART